MTKRSKRNAEDSPIVRQLRELYARGMDELEAKGRLRGRPRREYESAADHLHDLYAIGIEELETRRRAQQ